jgi:hypothetical protein
MPISFLAYSSALKMKVTCSSETSVLSTDYTALYPRSSYLKSLTYNINGKLFKYVFVKYKMSDVNVSGIIIFSSKTGNNKEHRYNGGQLA